MSGFDIATTLIVGDSMASGHGSRGVRAKASTNLFIEYRMQYGLLGKAVDITWGLWRRVN